MSNKNTPQIRFKDFTDAWEQRKLSEICKMHARIGWQNLRTSEFLETGDYYLITGTDFEDGKINLSTCHFVEKNRYDQDKNIQVENGSILITKDGTLGKVAYVEGLDKPATLNAGVFNVVILDKDSFDEKFLYQYLKAPFLMDYVNKRATGGTIKHLNQNILVDFPVVFPPSKSEQSRIGVFFRKLDDAITLHQRKCEKLKKIKSAFLSDMFPKNGESVPKRRFKGFADAWEQRKVSECVIIQRGGSPRPIDDFITKGDGVNWIKIGDVSQDSRYITSTEEKIIPEGVSKSRMVYPGDLILSNSMSFGRPYIMAIEGCIHDGWLLIRDEKGIFDKEFLVELLGTQSMLSQYKAMAAGSTVNNLNKDVVGATTISYPKSLAEQSRIGTFFHKLDDAITLHQRKCEKLKKIKAAYLKAMFV